MKLWAYMGTEVGTHQQPFPLCNASWLCCWTLAATVLPHMHAPLHWHQSRPATPNLGDGGKLGKKGPGPESCKELRFKFIFQEKTRLECLEMLVEVVVAQNSQKGGPYGPWTRKTCHFNWLIIHGKKHHKKNDGNVFPGCYRWCFFPP